MRHILKAADFILFFFKHFRNANIGAVLSLLSLQAPCKSTNLHLSAFESLAHKLLSTWHKQIELCQFFALDSQRRDSQ